jgi:hypothetical protein
MTCIRLAFFPPKDTMEAAVLDVSALRRVHRDGITQLSNSAVHCRTVDGGMLGRQCYISARGWKIGEGDDTSMGT